MAKPPAAPSGADPNGFAFDPCNECNPCQKPRRAVVPAEWWVKAEWLNWHFRDMPVPPLIVSGNPALPNAGIPGGGNSVPLVGPQQHLGQLNGARLTIGQWFDPDGELGGEVSGFIFNRNGTATFFQDNPARSLSVPVLGTNGTLGVYDFSFPGRFTGSLGIRTATQMFGGEGNLLRRVYGDGCVSLDALFGYRYMQLGETLGLFGRMQSAGATATFDGVAVPPQVSIVTTDTFRTCNEFHGIQWGARGEWRQSLFTLTGYGKFGVGINLETLRAEGLSQASGFGITRSTVGGLRALPSNFGRDTNTDFSLMSELGVQLGFQVTKNFSLRAGYNMLFWSNVIRPAGAMDSVTTLSQVPIDPTFNANAAATRPATVFRTSDFLAHGLVVGFVVDW
jgi:hypothetical protein